MTTPKPFATVDMKEQDFPFTVKWYAEDNDELLLEMTIEGPGALNVPGLGRPNYVVLHFPNGTTQSTKRV